MFLYQIQNFLISCLLFIFTSCSLSTTKGYLEQDRSVDFVENNYFSDTETDYVYKANFDVYQHSFGGILIIKMIQNENYRIVFTTEFGKNIFDFELVNNAFITHYILEDLNRKAIIQTLQNDFQILVKQNNKVISEFKNDHEIAYQTKLKERFNYYFISNEIKQLTKIISTSKKKEKLVINFNQIENEIARDIEIVHQNLKLRIHLNYMGE